MEHPDDAPDDADDIRRELQNIAVSRRQVADCMDNMPLRQAGDAVHLFAPAFALFRAAGLVFGRPFGE